MRSGTWLWLDRRFINKTCGGITAIGLGQEPFKKALWCSGLSRIRPHAQIIPTLGRTLCGQQKFAQRIILPHWRSRRLTQFWGGDPATEEHSSPLALLHLSHRLSLCTYFDNVYIMITNKPASLLQAGPLPFFKYFLVTRGLLLLKRWPVFSIKPAIMPSYSLGASHPRVQRELCC